MKKQLHLIAEISEWNWEINNDHHAAGLFATRLHAMYNGRTDTSANKEIQDLLNSVERHRNELQQIKDQLLELGSQLMTNVENKALQDTMHHMRSRVDLEMNAFAHLKYSYFGLMQQLLFSEN